MSQGDSVPEGVHAIDGITEEEDIEVIDTTKKSLGVWVPEAVVEDVTEGDPVLDWVAEDVTDADPVLDWVAEDVTEGDPVLDWVAEDVGVAV